MITKMNGCGCQQAPNGRPSAPGHRQGCLFMRSIISTATNCLMSMSFPRIVHRIDKDTGTVVGYED